MQANMIAQSSGTGVNGGAVAAFLAIGLVVAVLCFIGWRNKQKEIRAFRAWASRYGYRYERRDDSVAGVSSVPPFGIGRERKCVDVFRGTYRDTRLLFFQYDYASGSGDRSVSLSYQVVAIDLPQSLPVLDIGQEGFLSRWDEDIDFENPRFNDLFKIQSTDRRFAFDVIDPRTMEWMLADRRAQTYQWRFDGPWLMSIRPGGVDLGDVFTRADFLLDVYARVPRHVWLNP
ncbi:hypothetical protein [Glycomyces arizonensis]|uniref:hypothetical protein n=1 Tax=Glycomyces arizonensis TaxID=256035 RepID=UPI00040AAFC8|nr:hypothetical protein [Glycomyces arizonensis]